jgi:hypothetical protein
MKSYVLIVLCLSLVLLPGILWAQDVNEEDIFSDSNTVQNEPPQDATTQNKNTQGVNEGDIFSDGNTVIGIEKKQDEKVTDALTQESKSFSGEIATNFTYYATRDCLEGNADWGDNPYTTSVDGDFLLDVRLNKGIKAFGDLWVTYSPQDEANNPDTDHFQNTLKELFVDVNIARKVYFRFGKQNLKWGRGYFWNPTDVISEDRKDFNDLNARLEGVYGLKMHIPFGTKVNIYSFLNASSANTTKDFALAGKFEILLPHNIEMAVSAWTKDGYRAVYGLDFATYKLGMDWRGEISISHGDNRHRLVQQNGEFIDTQVTDEWVPRLCLGFTRLFDAGNYTDRISLTGEFYYNHGGYERDMLQDPMLRGRFLQGGYFEPNNYGKYYAALFSSYSKFLLSDMTFNLNAIGNVSDSSWILSSGVAYQLANNAALNVNITGYLGAKNREYTFAGNAISAEVSVNLSF